LRHTGWRTADRRGIWFAAAVWFAAAGCAGERGDLGEIRKTYAQAKYEEALSLCERSIRKGNADGRVYYYSGMSLLAMDRDAEAIDRFRAGLASDTTLAEEISSALLERASASLAGGMSPRAALLAEAAADIDRDAVDGPLLYAVALGAFEKRRWSDAAYWYGKAIAEYPDTGAAESAYFNLAACRAATGDTLSAIEALDTEIERFPGGELAERALWSRSSLLFARARTEFSRGEYDAALRTAERVAAGSAEPLLVQKAKFLMGESYERKGEFDRAYAAYEAIAEENGSAPGGIAEKARAKMKSFRDAGLR